MTVVGQIEGLTNDVEGQIEGLTYDIKGQIEGLTYDVAETERLVDIWRPLKHDGGRGQQKCLW